MSETKALNDTEIEQLCVAMFEMDTKDLLMMADSALKIVAYRVNGHSPQSTALCALIPIQADRKILMTHIELPTGEACLSAARKSLDLHEAEILKSDKPAEGGRS